MLVLLATGWRLPAPVQQCCSAVGGCTTPLALMIVGVLLADSDIRALLFLFELTAPLAFVLVWFYNGQRGACSPLQKKAFYWFYPVHLLVLAGITNLLL